MEPRLAIRVDCKEDRPARAIERVAHRSERCARILWALAATVVFHLRLERTISLRWDDHKTLVQHARPLDLFHLIHTPVVCVSVRINLLEPTRARALWLGGLVPKAGERAL